MKFFIDSEGHLACNHNAAGQLVIEGVRASLRGLRAIQSVSQLRGMDGLTNKRNGKRNISLLYRTSPPIEASAQTSTIFIRETTISQTRDIAFFNKLISSKSISPAFEFLNFSIYL